MCQFWPDFAVLPRERFPSHSAVMGPSKPLCSPVFSICLASVREVTSCIGAGLGAAGCALEVVASGDPKHEIAPETSSGDNDLIVRSSRQKTFKRLLDPQTCWTGEF